MQRFFFVCSVSFLFAAFPFCLQCLFFVCSVDFLFPAFLFCLQRFLFVCSVCFLFAALVFCLQRFFFVCSVSLVGHRRKGTEIRQLFSLEMTLNINGKGITNPKTVSDCKKYAIFCVSKVLIWRQKWVVVFQFGRDSFETVYTIQFGSVWFCRLRQDLCQVAQ